jgi:predicted MPP superfamily phosphohydrolase
MHLYAFRALSKGLATSPAVTRLLTIWMVVMTAAPLLVRKAENYCTEIIAQLIAWPAFIWMGTIFIFSVVAGMTDVTIFILKKFIRHTNFDDSKPDQCSSRRMRYILVITLLTSLYACIEARTIRTPHITITSSKVPESTAQIRIALLSDVHLGLLLGENRLKSIVNIMNRQKPDLVISTGDLVDGKLNWAISIAKNQPLIDLLNSIQAPLGKFAVIGNHEVYSGLQQADEFTRAAGFTLLRNSSVLLSHNITVTGIDDQAANLNRTADQAVESALAAAVDKQSFHLLLKHRPELLDGTTDYFDLQLSGHVHGGQIFPFNLLVKLKHAVQCGITQFPSGSHMYVSRGTGTWGPPMRLLAPPEITIIDIMPSKHH